MQLQAQGLMHTALWVSIIVNPRWGGYAVNPKIVQKSRNNIL